VELLSNDTDKCKIKNWKERSKTADWDNSRPEDSMNFYIATRGTCPAPMNLLDWGSVVMFVADHKSRGLLSCHYRSPTCTHRRNNVVTTGTRLQVALSGVRILAVGGDLPLFAEVQTL